MQTRRRRRESLEEGDALGPPLSTPLAHLNNRRAGRQELVAKTHAARIQESKEARRSDDGFLILVSRSDDEDDQFSVGQGPRTEAIVCGMFLGCIDPEPRLAQSKKIAKTQQTVAEVIPESESEDEFLNDVCLTDMDDGVQIVEEHVPEPGQLKDETVEDVPPLPTPDASTPMVESKSASTSHVIVPSAKEPPASMVRSLLSLSNFDFLVERQSPPPMPSSPSAPIEIQATSAPPGQATSTEFAASFHENPGASTQRAYPLRKRTFQQRKPYTADKQRHLNLIRSRGIAPKRSSDVAKDGTNGWLSILDEALVQNKSDEEDSDYEERHKEMSQPSPAKTLLDKNKFSNRLTDDPLNNDNGDDELPSLDQLQESIRSGQIQPSSSYKFQRQKDRRVQSGLKTTIDGARMLSKGALKEAARIANLQIDSMLPVNVPTPFEPTKKLPGRTYQSHHRRTRTSGNRRDRGRNGASSSDVANMDEDNSIFTLDNDILDGQQFSENESCAHETGDAGPHTNINEAESMDIPQEKNLHAKKTRRIRQHVLPMSFFKRNRLPDDQNVLMSMRSQILRSGDDPAHSSSPTSARRHDEPSVPIQPHHARTRIASRDTATEGGDSLKDFMSRLAQEGSDSDDGEVQGYHTLEKESLAFDDDDFDSVARYSTPGHHRYRSRASIPNRSRRPSWKDTIPVNTTFSYDQQYHNDYTPGLDFEYEETEMTTVGESDDFDHNRVFSHPSRKQPRIMTEAGDTEGSAESELDAFGLPREKSLRKRVQNHKGTAARTYFTEERGDMIDRMQARSAAGPGVKRSGSRKRRRTSGRHRSLKAIRLAALENGGVHRAAMPRGMEVVDDRISRSVDAETDISMEDEENEWEETSVSPYFSDTPAHDSLFDPHAIGAEGPRERQLRIDRFVPHRRVDTYDVEGDGSDLEDFTRVVTRQREQRQIRSIHPQRPPTQISRPRRRKSTGLSRAKVVPRQPIHKQKKRKVQSNQPKGASKPTSIQTTLILGNQIARPQLVDKPSFQPSARAETRHRQPDDDYDSMDDFVHEGITASDTFEPPSINENSSHIQVEAGQKERQLTLPKANRPLPPPRGNRTLESLPAADSRPVTSVFDPMPNGVYFPRDSYIGGGRLAQVLTALSPSPLSGLSHPMVASTGFQLFDEWFLPDWTQPQIFADELWPAFYEIKRRGAIIQQMSWQLQRKRGSLEEAKRVANDCLKALDTITLVLLERVAPLPSTHQEAFWLPFMQGFCRALEGLFDNMDHAHSQHQGGEKDDPASFPNWLFIAKGRWTLVAWAALFRQFKTDRLLMIREDAERDGQGYSLTLGRIVGSLMRQLIPASGSAFCHRINKIVASGQSSMSSLMVLGEDVMELWICLIQLLGIIDDQDQGKLASAQAGFWHYLNRQVQQGWMNETSRAERERVASDEWTHQKANHILELIINLCRLHQFEKQGSTDTSLRAGDNWCLIQWMAQHHWIVGLNFEIAAVDPLTVRSRQKRLREFLVYYHSLLSIWHWSPSPDMVLLVYRYFSARGFADLTSEPGYRMPEFLKQLISKESSVPDNDLKSEQRRIGGVLLDVVLLEQLSDHDRCFEIFLKIVGLSVFHLVRSIESDQDMGQEGLSAMAASSSSFRTTGHDTAITGVMSEAVSASPSISSSRPLSRQDKIRNCKRLLSSISPAIVTSFPTSRPSGGPGYSTLCNPCNLVLLITLLVPDNIRPSSAGQLQSFLDFDVSDDASQRVMLQAMTYLGLAWQRQWFVNDAAFPRRHVEDVLDFLFAKTHAFANVYEQDLRVLGQDSNAYISRTKRHWPVAALIEACLGYIMDLLSQLESFHSTPFPPLAYLDRRIGGFFDRGAQFPPEMRLQALGIIEKILEVRKKHFDQVWQRRLAEAALATTVAPASTKSTPLHSDHTEVVQAPTSLPQPFNDNSNHQHDQNGTTVLSLDDGFSSLDFEQFDFDDADLFSPEHSSSQQARQQIKGASGSSRLSSNVQMPKEPILERDVDLAKQLNERVLPWIESLLKERHQLLQEQNKQSVTRFSASSMNAFTTGSVQSRSNEFVPSGNNSNRMSLFKGPLDSFTTTTAMQPAFGSRSANTLAGTAVSLATSPSNIIQISQQGVWRFLKVLARSYLILFRQGSLTLLEAVDRMFKREMWLSLWIQAARQTDELAWATFLLEERPQLAVEGEGEHEDYFLGLWFSTITTPTTELSLQYRFLRALLHSTDNKAVQAAALAAEKASPMMSPGSSVSSELLKDLPFAHLDYGNSQTGDQTASPRASAASATVDILKLSLLSTDADLALFHGFKEARLQILLKVLSNMGDHFARTRGVDLEQTAATANAQMVQHRSQTSFVIKTKYQKYLGLVLHQIKSDYERMELRRQTRDSIQVVELAHHVIGHIIQHCGLILQNSKLTGSADSILGFLTSSQHFPQPKIDDLFLIQKIRGFAYLYQAGDRQFFNILLGMLKSQLSKVKGVRAHSYADNRCDMEGIDDGQSRMVPPFHSTDHRRETKINIFEGDIAIHSYTDGDANWLTDQDASAPVIPKDFQVQPVLPRHGQSSIKSFVHVASESKENSAAKNPLDPSKLATHTLAASLRNVVSESEDRRQWNKALSAFRMMVFMSITNPCLVAFWGSAGQGSSGNVSWNNNQSWADVSLARQSVPSHPELMMVSTSVAHTLQEVLCALLVDIALLPTLSPSSTPNYIARLAGYEDFERETSVMFAPILQALYGTEMILDQTAASLDVVVMDVLVGSQSIQQQQQQQQQSRDQRLATLLQSSDTRNALRAFHLAGQLLELLATMARIARRIQVDFPQFYESNESWREAFMDLVRYGWAYGYRLLARLLDGPTPTETTTPTVTMADLEQQQHPAHLSFSDIQGMSNHLSPPGLSSSDTNTMPMLLSPPTKSDVLSLESSLQEFVTSRLSNGLYRPFKETVMRELIQSQLRPMALQQDAQSIRTTDRRGVRSAGSGSGIGHNPFQSFTGGNPLSSLATPSSSKVVKAWAADCLLEDNGHTSAKKWWHDRESGISTSTTADEIVRTTQSCIFGFWHEIAMLDTEFYRQGLHTKALIEDRLNEEPMLVEALSGLIIHEQDTNAARRDQRRGIHADTKRIQRARAILAHGEFTRWKEAMTFGRSSATTTTAQQHSRRNLGEETRTPGGAAVGGVRAGGEEGDIDSYAMDDIML